MGIEQLFRLNLIILGIVCCAYALNNTEFGARYKQGSVARKLLFCYTVWLIYWVLVTAVIYGHSVHWFKLYYHFLLLTLFVLVTMLQKIITKNRIGKI
jgi:hypothetical protein